MKSQFRKIILLLVTITFLYFIFVNLDFKELFVAIKNFKLKYLLSLIFVICMTFTCRGICFKLLISKFVKVPLKDLIPLCVSGAALNIFLPARAGDLFRAYYVGQKYNKDKVKLFGTVMLERIFDGLIVLSLLIFGILAYNRNPLAQNLCIGAAAIFIGGFIFSVLAIKYNKIDDICGFIANKTDFLPEKVKSVIHSMLHFTNKICNSFVSGFEVLNHPKQLILVFLASASIWFFECLKYYVVIKGFNCDVSLSVILFIISFIALACMIPSTSIFIGPYQFAVIAAFAIYNISKETALAMTFVEQSVVTLTTVFITTVFLVKNNISFKEIKEDVKINK